MTRLLLPMAEAGEQLGVGRTTMYDLAARGEVEVVHIGRRALVTEESLSAFVDRLRAKARGPDDASDQDVRVDRIAVRLRPAGPP
jgi:excisionase family DNA binding protein